MSWGSKEAKNIPGEENISSKAEIKENVSLNRQKSRKMVAIIWKYQDTQTRIHKKKERRLIVILFTIVFLRHWIHVNYCETLKAVGRLRINSYLPKTKTQVVSMWNTFFHETYIKAYLIIQVLYHHVGKKGCINKV